MRPVLLVTFVLLLCASVVFAQVGRIGIFGDTQGQNCVYNPSAPFTTFLVYLVHIDAVGVTASQFIAPKPPCLNALWLNDSEVFPVVIGTTQTSKSIAYGSCKSGTFHICTMNFLSQGANPDCCVFYVLPDPQLPSGLYEFSDCDFIVHNGGGKAGVANQTGACSCEAIPVEDSSWGQIKALYSE